MATIRQVSHSRWESIIASKGSKQVQDQFLSDIDKWRANWASRAQALAAQLKSGSISYTEFNNKDSVLNQEATDYLLSVGFYESVSDTMLDTEFHDDIITAIKDRPAILLRIITSATNYYRGQQKKVDLTESQVKSRLLA